MSDEITKQAQTLSLMHPLNIYPTAVGGTILLFNAVEYSLLTTAIGGAALAVGVGSILFNRFVNVNKFYQIAAERQHEKLVKQMQQTINHIYEQLIQYKRSDVANQLSTLDKKVQMFNDIINKRFKGGGLAYSRFSGVADAIMSNGIKSYEEILLLSRQASNIDDVTCATQIRKFQDTGGHEEQIRELQTRIKVKQDLNARIERMVLSNEQAITKLDLTLSSLGDISTENEINWAMQELQSLSNALTTDNGETL